MAEPGLRRLWLKVWLLCGTLDAFYATILTTLRGGSAAQVWLFVASGPFGDSAAGWGLTGVIAGLAVHFALMAVMTGAGLWLARKTMLGAVATWKAGTVYGLALYYIMYGIVLPQRFGVAFPDPDRIKVALGLFPHIFLVGLPMFTLFKDLDAASQEASAVMWRLIPIIAVISLAVFVSSCNSSDHNPERYVLTGNHNNLFFQKEIHVNYKDANLIIAAVIKFSRDHNMDFLLAQESLPAGDFNTSVNGPMLNIKAMHTAAVGDTGVQVFAIVPNTPTARDRALVADFVAKIEQVR